MKKIILPALVTFAFAYQTNPTEHAIKKEFTNVILPKIMKDLKNGGHSRIIIDIRKYRQYIKIDTYKDVRTSRELIPIFHKGSYQTGYKYYAKYIAQPSHIKISQFVKKSGITNKNIDALFKNNAKLLIENLQKNGLDIAVKGVEFIIKKGKLNDLKEFLKGVLAGKVPASCS